ncbi:MAG: PAS domain-containing protein [Deltaproteobacteria bacterium]|nr:PAS domain-containing protein [Deltaproteobacteria bacterium]
MPIKKTIPKDKGIKDSNKNTIPESSSPPVTSKKRVKKSPSEKSKIKPDKKSSSFAIVGIGASAGGLEAYEEFFTKMPPDSGMAFVLIMHLDPKRKSIICDLISNYTSMKVSEVKNGVKVRPNCVYTIPPNKDMSIFKGVLHLIDQTVHRGLKTPIDYFLSSLAEDQQEKAIGVILSGTGTEGAFGLKAIRGVGGLTIVQKPESAKYDGMPRNVIQMDVMDYVLTPKEMPERLLNYIHHKTSLINVDTISDAYKNATQKAFAILKNYTGNDFSEYKYSTIHRRIDRRMTVNQIDKIQDYVKFLEQSHQEVQTLFKDLLIGVTHFFRAPKAFSELQNTVIPHLVKHSSNNDIIRVWVPGCATGEEAYSIAIVIKEFLDKQKYRKKIQIFATDIDEKAIDFARIGKYPSSIIKDVSKNRLKLYFDKEQGEFQVKPEIRGTVVFAMQNVIKDPPFSKLDLICCRNLLIYFTSNLQRKILPTFHYCLNNGGILFLGSAETVGENTSLFSTFNREWKFYEKKPQKNVRNHNLGIESNISFASESKENRWPKHFNSKKDIIEMTNHFLINEFSPVCIVLDLDFEIIYIHGRTGKYLESTTGEISNNILKLARDGLKLELIPALQKAKSHNKTIVCKRVRVQANGDYQEIRLTIKPIFDSLDKGSFIIVIIQDLDVLPVESLSNAEQNNAKGKEKRKDITSLELELRTNKEYLQTTIEELETSNEELKSTNEELQSANEELQSTNEEMETSKEELQSVNEELITVNTELQNKIEEFTRTNNDMTNLLASTEIGTVFLDSNLVIKRFTPAMTKIINLIPTDVGRTLSSFTMNLYYENLEKDAFEVLQNLIVKEIEIKSKAEKWYSLRIIPYRTSENMIDGVVLTFLDISKNKLIVERERGLELALRNSSVVIFNQDIELRYTWVYNLNQDFNPAHFIGKTDFDLLPSRDAKKLTEIKHKVLEKGIRIKEKLRSMINHIPFEFDLIMDPMFDSKNSIIGVTSITIDNNKLST